MKYLLLALAAVTLWLASTGLTEAGSEATTLIVGGDVLGYLAPCGCTKPMVGGILRWASAARTLQSQGPSVVVVNGGFAKGRGRQDELKLEALAQSYRMLSVQAVNLTLHEAAMGRGAIASLQRLTGNALTTLSIELEGLPEAQPTIASGPFLIAGASENSSGLSASLGEPARTTDQTVQELVDQAEAQKLAPVLLWSGSESSATAIAQKHPSLAAIVFSSTSVLRSPVVVGKTWLLTPGEKGRALVSAKWDGEKFVEYGNVALGPEIEDDKEVDGAYARYLERVRDEELLKEMPRPFEDQYVGSQACFPCHESAAQIWKDSKHAAALATLEEVRHDKDPDCVGCHVVGLDSVHGFQSREETPTKADVGCESCHGAGKEHVASPKTSRMGKVGEKPCMKCHVTDHSPNFDFAAYWEKIKH